VLSGFLGSGKTTLLNRILEADDAPKTAVIVNEFGEISLDHLLIRQVEASRTVLKNGCVCCVIRTDLQTALRDLLDRMEPDGAPFERIIIETTGLADPGPIARTIGTDPMLRGQMRLAGTIVTVDGMHGKHQLEFHPECMRQVAIADRLVVTKSDLSDCEMRAALTETLRSINTEAQIIDGYTSRDAIWTVLHDMAVGGRSGMICAPVIEIRHRGVSSIHIETDRTIDWTAFSVWLSAFVHCHADRVLRIKGLLAVPDLAAPLVLHVVRDHIHVPDHLESWPDENRSSRIVFIVQDLDVDALRRSLLDFIGHAGPASEGGASNMPARH
jgi:G3E family GTPase